MRLKKIVIHGFKSFAEKEAVEFGPGITAIVGPNGCGKSNIIDAFRWVMGEQSAKAIRGERMIDILFGGTEKRRPLNFAEVSLHFSNEEGRLPLAIDEVAITRRLHRDGESLYAINKAAARLKDIETLFWDTGLGKDAFSIFEQGKLDEIITSSPYERRSIIEEAAGIMRFKQRRKEALRKLEATEENLVRLRDIQQMTLQKKEHLLQQGEKARAYQELEKDVNVLEKEIALYEIHKQTEKGERLQKQCEKNRETLETIRAAGATLELQKEAALARRHELSLLAQEALKAAYEKSSEYQLKEQRLTSLCKEKERVQSTLERLAREKRELKEQQSNAESEKKALLQTLERTKQDLIESEGVVQKLRERLEVVLEEQAALWREKTAYNERKMQRLRHENGLKATFQEWVFKEQAVKERLAKMAHDEAKIQQDLNLDIESLIQLVDEKKSLYEQASHKHQQLQQQESHLQTTELEKSRLAASFQGKIATLDQLKANLRDGSKKLIEKGLARPLAEVLVWKEEYEKALLPYETLLVVDKQETLQQIVQEASGDVALFCLEWLEGRSLEEHFLGFQKTSAVPTSLQKEQVGEGFWIDNKGVLFMTGKGPSTVFSRKRERDILAKQLKKVEEELARLREEKKELHGAKAEQSTELHKLGRELKEAEIQKSQAVTTKERLQRVLSALVKEREGLNSQEITENREKAEKALQEYQGVEEEPSSFEEKQKELSLMRQQIEASLQDKALQHKAKGLAASEQRLAHLEATLNGLAKRASGIDLEEEQLQCSYNQVAAEEGGLTLNETELQKAKDWHEETAAQLQQAELALEQLEAALKAHAAEREKQQNSGERYSLDKAQNETALAMLEERYRERFGEKEPYKGMPPQGNLEQLKEQMAQLGAINFSAAEELVEAEKESERLVNQVADLDKAKNELFALISSLDGESGTRFLETFHQVQKAFQRNFTTLFGGGSADLKLVGSEDPLEAGIDIYAMPPGKAMKSLYLMSGGERCLTALALLFALFEVKPSPFCLLDEVDAPLDEANVERFAKMVSSYIDKTQFVIITHNKNTMAIADRLLGVSAEEKGVSRIIPLELKTCP